jgi:hypothetical protein
MLMSCHACPHSVRNTFEQPQMSVSPSRQQQGQQQWQSSMLVCFQLSRNTVCADCSNCDIAAAVNSTARMRIIIMGYTHATAMCPLFPLNPSSCRQQVQVYVMLGRNVEPQRPCHHLTKEGLEGCSCNPVVTATLPISPSC